MRFPFVAFVFVCLAVMTLPLLGQSPNGNINGLISDPSGATVVDADVVAVNDVTHVAYTTKTNSEGIYALPNLPPGPYGLQISKIGFKTLIKRDITLNVQDSLSINFTLLVGAFHEIVTVQGGAPLVSVESATVSTMIDPQFAENLPMNGRSFQTLLYLTPGVTPVTSTQNDSGQFSVNGQRSASNYWFVDGVSANIGIGAGNPGNGLGGTLGAFSALGGTNSLVSVDALQEFRIQTSTFAPEFGRTPGAQISIVTRSGSNLLHGVAFDYLRNNVFDASNWFNGYTNVPPLPKAEERQNDFGGTFSGPLLKDKSFFFFSYEGLRLRLPQTLLTNVPDLSARRLAMAAMQPYMHAFPLPNGADDVDTGIAQFNASYSNPAGLDAYSIRLDHKVNHGWSLFGRYDYSPSQFIDRGGNLGGAALSDLGRSQITTQTVTTGANWVASPTILNDLRFNYSRNNAKSYFYMDQFGGAVPLENLPFPADDSSQNARFSLAILSLGIGDQVEVGKLGQNVQRQINLVDNLSWQTGSHSLKFGVDFRTLFPAYAAYQYAQSAFFGSVAASEVGSAVFGTILSNAPATFLFRNLGVFGQDTWRVSPRLILTYGLRWDVDFAPLTLNGPSIPAVSGYKPTDFSKLAIAPPGTPAFRTAYDNFAPRAGLAFQMSQNAAWRNVLRGGVGTFYDLVDSETGNLVGAGFPPFGNTSNLFGQNFPFTPALSASPPIPPNGTLSGLLAFNPNLRLPYTLEWNAAFEQSLGTEQTISVTYVGSDGRRLLQSTEFIRPPTNPNVELALFVDNTATSNYNALQIQFQRRLSRGLQVISSYTWSHSIDDASASSYGNSSNLGVPASPTENRGNSDFDIRNAFTLALTYDIATPSSLSFAKSILRGWSTDSSILGHSAPPVDLTDIQFSSFDSGIRANIRPDVVPGENLYLYGAKYPGGKAFNSSAFTAPPVDLGSGNPLRQGDLPRNKLRGFGFREWDFALHRDFPLRESFKLQFRAEIFNLLNHPNFGPPYNQFGATGFGISTQMLGQSLAGPGGLGGGAFNPLYQIGGPRSIQFSLRLIF